MSGNKTRVLVVDDHEVTRKLLREVLEKEGYSAQLAESGEEAVRLIGLETFPVVISDIRMLELDGMAVLREVKRLRAGSAVILMTGFGSMEGAVEAIRDGAFDYVSKPFKIDELKAVVARGIKHWESLNRLKGSVALPAKLDVSSQGLIGKSPRIVEVYKTVARAAMSDSSVLISGESGTGKELVARGIHEHSARRKKSFIPVSCGALSESVLETELFGKGKGSKGLFDEATGGTLFLDEIGDLSPALQVRLLRVDGDVRLIGATRHDLESLVKAARFREDLFYKLKVISIELPALRHRIEDLPDLIHHFLARFAGKNQKPVSHVSDEAFSLLRSYSWPGNVRELEHAIERAVAMTSTPVLFPEDFPPEISRRGVSPEPAAIGGSTDPSGPASSLEEIEKAHILKVLQDVNFNKSKASEILGIDRATLYRKAQRYGIDLRGR